MKKKISIIAPCYNGEKYITRFFESILNQTCVDIQLIIINDGSTDKTEDILKSYEDILLEKGIEYIHIMQSNQGIGAAINNVLKLVNAHYLTWLGTDDFIYPQYVEKMTSFLENNNDYAVVRCDGNLVDENDVNKVIGNFACNNDDKYNPYLFENAILEKGFHFGYSVIDMDIFDKCNPKRYIYPSRQGQNWQLLLPVLYNHKSGFIDECLYAVVENSESVSRSPHKIYESVKEQNKEYEKILVEVLTSMDIKEKDYYLEMVENKYIRRRIKAALDFDNYADALYEFSLLRNNKAITLSDVKLLVRAKFPYIHRLIKRIRG